MNKASMLQEIKDHLNLKSDAELARHLNVKPNVISNWKNRNAFDTELIYTKCDFISADWLLTGEGPMLKNSTQNENGSTLDAGIIKHVPLVSQYAQAGYLNGFDDMVYLETLPTVPVIIEHEAKGNYVCFEVRGDSMTCEDSEDSLLEGDILVCREVSNQYWRDKLHIKKWDFVIVHKENGILVKRIIKHNTEIGTITIHSLNPMYNDEVLHINDIQQLFNIVKIQRNRRR